ncbi:ATP-binding protein DrrA1-3 family domain-containing protein [Actinomadura madurae]|uniref:ATP-binding protein DrrA1-3 family domain-containing protein n=1 Tax=Actinomadura madurae TaxID=1993 RepID=UPI0020D2569B|nr:DUF4162 domain-containing protein [Actinomadura madurae]MCQ0014408.1 DUF4162 domain-containing protein [Actinomadura madurae]
MQDVCHRVAILREGRLVEVAALEELRGLAGTVLEAIIDGPVPDLAGVPGVTGVEPVEGGVRVSVTGSPSPVLSRLSDCPLVRLRSHEPTLEEIFLSYYEAEK